MKYTKEVIIIIICTILMNSNWLNAQDTVKHTRTTGIMIDYRVNDSFSRILKMFEEAGYGLELDGTTQTVIVDVYDFTKSTKYPNNAAAIAIGTNNDTGIFIRVNSQIWYYMNANSRDFTLLHELGHDYFNLQHSKDRDNLMYPSLPIRIDSKDVLRAFNQLVELCRSN